MSHKEIMTKPELGLINQEPGTVPSIDIPLFVAMDGWKSVPIDESNQNLILLNGLHERIKTQPMYHFLGIPNAQREISIRQEAAERLIRAAELLPPQHSLMVYDAYRPIEVQREIFNAQKAIFNQENPNLSEDELTRLTERYVSLPSTDPSRPSPHATGGAIDLTILDESKPLDMGTVWDSFNLDSRTEAFRQKDQEIHNNRKLLYKIMVEAGFTNYPEEWWHYDFGNQFWGHISKNHAIYGLVEGGEHMIERNDKNPAIASDLIQGPFVVNLATQRVEGQPQTMGRFILGGGENAREQVVKSMQEINSLADGLSWDELRGKATEIFSGNGLLRVDF